MALTASERALAALLVEVCVGPADAVAARLSEATAAGATDAEIDELLLLGPLYAGYPRTINAFAAWRASGRGAAVALPAALDRAAAGASAFEAVYGDRADRVRAELARLHPDLERAVIEDAYGRTLSRPVLSLRVKELVAVPVLIATDAPKQLASHVAGARRAGADDAEILEAAEQAKARCARGAFAPAISRVREALAKG